MEPKFQSSFIPKGPIAQGPVTGARISRGGKSFFGLIATLIFAIALLSSIGVFGYRFYLSRSITSMGTDLEAARQNLQPSTITELTRLNSRLISTQRLLTNHSVLSPLFDFLETSTLKNVRFTDFKYVAKGRAHELSMRGQARGYAAVALQSDILNKSTYLKNQIFEGLDLDEKGNVVFTFSATVEPTLLSYRVNSVAPSRDVVIPTPVISTSTSTSTPSRPVTSTTTSSNTQPR